MIFQKTLMADFLTPITAYLRVARRAGRAFLLESVEGGINLGRYSFIGVDPTDSFSGSFSGFRKAFPEPIPHEPGLPPFTGGAVGYFSYDMARELERLPDLHLSPEENPYPPSVNMDYYSTVIAFDHLKKLITIVSHEGKERIEELHERLSSNDRVPAPISMVALPHFSLESAFSRQAFIHAVERAKEYIRAGDIFQVVLSRRFEAEYDGDPFNVYRALRHINPSPYLFFIKQGDIALAGSSPEMLVKVRGRRIEYRPIAGTRHRGKDAEEEKQLEEELLSDEKERAEHLMLVDLGRNDLGRVSEYGSVRVDEFMQVERYSHVMHLVSKLGGKLKPELDSFDALAACFPAGTVSGAPKIRAMEIIEELEPHRRGIYAGAVGYVDYSGYIDTCIGIRTVVLSGGKAHLQAGAGIVADSDPEFENNECRNKAMALANAVEMAKQL